MKRKSGKLSVIILVWAGLIFTVGSCVKEEFSFNKLDTSVDLQPAVATPLGYFDFRLDENLQTSENAVISTNPDRIVSLNYFGEIVSQPAGELFTFERVAEVVSLPNPTGGVIDLSSRSYETVFEAKFPLFLNNTGGTARIDSILMSEAYVRISDIMFPDPDGIVYIDIPGLKLNGEALRITMEPGDNNLQADVSGYTLELTSEEERNNLIDVKMTVVYPQQRNILYATLPLVDFNFYINITEWARIDGYLGRETIDFGRVNFSTDLKENFPGGEFFSYDPRLTFKTLNSFSVPLAMGLSDIIAETRDSGQIILSGPGVPTPPEYFYPAFPVPGPEVSIARDSMTIDSDNSNLESVTTSAPLQISYDVEFTTNPNEEIVPNIVYAESEFLTRVELQLPFDGRAKGLAVKDTLAMDFSQFNLTVNEYVESIDFKLYYENSFPAEIDLQLYLADENLMVTDTVFDSFKKLKSAEPIDVPLEDPPFVSGEVEGSLPGEKLDNILATRFIIGEARLTTGDVYDRVKIFDTQSLFLNMGIVFHINTSIEDF